MSRLRLFEAYGVELEYMIVDAGTLAVRPIADRLLLEDGQVTSEVEKGPVSWSNELVSHVLELKTTTPSSTLEGLAGTFAEHVREANRLLEPHGAMLLGTGAHPFFDPETETVIWPGEYTEVYRTYDRIFGVRGHGWSNLQSSHLNLPFCDDDEFGRLHGAIRVLLPILPALAASTPFLDGRRPGPMDARLHVYRHNQDRVPELVGRVIPEPVFTEAAYESRIFGPIQAALRPLDPDRVLRKHFANSRGAIARFDRGSIEIRVLDLQECPAADLAVLALVSAVLRRLASGEWGDVRALQRWDTDPLAEIFDGCVRDAERHEIRDAGYLDLWGLDASSAPAAEVWSGLVDRVGDALDNEHRPALETILAHGPLARRLTRALGDAPDRGALRQVYGELARCLAWNRPFVSAG